MKTAALASALLSATAFACLASVKPAEFPCVRDVSPPPDRTADVAAFVLDADVFDKLDARMANFRLYDDAGREQPSLIRQRIPLRTTTAERAFAAPARAESFRQLPDNRIELVVTRDPNHQPTCGLRLESGIRNFEKLVTVSGSADGRNWSTLVTDEPIYDYSRFVDIRKDTIRFPPSDFTHFRLQISNITENKDSPLVEIIRQTRGAGGSNEVEATSFRREPFRIERLVLMERVTETARHGGPEEGEFAVTGWTAADDAKNRRTVIEFSTRRQPLTAVVFGTDDLNFSRSVTVEASDDGPGRRTWHHVAAGRISRIHAGVIRQDSLSVHFPRESRFRAYRVTIENQDSPPLTIASLTAKETRYEAIFFPKPGQKYRAAYGNADIPPASYDIGAVLAACSSESALLWSLGPETGNPEFSPGARGFAINGKLVLTVSTIAMVVVLTIVIALLIRKIGVNPQPPQDQG
jgi:hypothetical protein